MDIRNRIESLIELSEQMLEKAHAGDWDYVSESDANRRKRFEALFSGPELAALGEHFNKLQRLIDLDRELLQVTRSARDASAVQVNELRTKKKRALAYEEHKD